MATANNVMSVGLQPGGARPAGGSARGARSSGDAGARKDARFGDALGKAQESESLPVEATEDSMEAMPQDAMAASLAPAQEGGAEAQTANAEMTEGTSDVEGISTLQVASNAGLSMNAGLFMQANGIQQALNAQLQTILPQSESEGAKSQSMLQMLSGQNWRQMESPAGLQPLSGEVTLQTMAAKGMPSIQGAAVQGKGLQAQQVGDSQILGKLSQDGQEIHDPAQQQSGQQGVPKEAARQVLANTTVQQTIAAQNVAQGGLSTTAGASAAVMEEVPQIPAQVQGSAKDVQGLLQSAASMEMDSASEQPVIPLREALHGQSPDGQQDRQSSGQFQSQVFQPMMKEAAETEQVPLQFTSVTEDVPSENQPVTGIPQTVNNASTQSTGTVDVPNAPRQDFDIPAQIVEQARLIRRSENTEMVIHLKPEHLGELTLKVSVGANGVVNASFHSDNAQVRAIIENSLVQLRQELSNQGLKVDNVEVYAGLSEDSLLNGQGQQAWQQGQQGNSSRNRNLDYESYEEETVDSVAANDALGDAEGVDYRI